MDGFKVACGGLLALTWVCGSARSASGFDPYAAFMLEHNSNLFAVPSSKAVSDPRGVPQLSDTLKTYLVGAESYWLVDRQRFFATLEGRRTYYDQFTDLNHNEYLVDLGLNWKLSKRFDGILEARQQRQIVSFTDRTVTGLTTQTDKILKGSFNTALTPVWRLESQAESHTLDSPLQTAPDFSLREVSETIGLKYVGIANLAYGVEGSHAEGKYKGAPGAVDYRQNTAQFALKYAIGGLTNINAALGYTQRSLQGSSGKLSGVTGALGYARQLTGKTAVNVQFSRLVNSYYNAGSSEIDTGGTAGIVWQATPKLGVSVNYQHTRSVFEGQTLPNTNTQGRVDSSNYSSLELRYQPRLWVTLRPYVRRQIRDSNIGIFTFSGTVYGIEVRFRDEKPKG
jgi:hypothetical protein